jgi:hypothetical protein
MKEISVVNSKNPWDGYLLCETVTYNIGIGHSTYVGVSMIEGEILTY